MSKRTSKTDELRNYPGRLQNALKRSCCYAAEELEIRGVEAKDSVPGKQDLKGGGEPVLQPFTACDGWFSLRQLDVFRQSAFVNGVHSNDE